MAMQLIRETTSAVKVNNVGVLLPPLSGKIYNLSFQIFQRKEVVLKDILEANEAIKNHSCLGKNVQKRQISLLNFEI